jgi:alkanesulfonate monooxygenase SsuD/methylene tetrahydromethanopterin reductase-like flavin-dependent oxidoreductase (luciferase family)
MRRIARVSDGYFPSFRPDETGRETLARLRQIAKDAGRDPADIGIEGRINFSDGDPEHWQNTANGWRELDATHLSVNTMQAGLSNPQAHIDAIQQFKEVVSG